MGAPNAEAESRLKSLARVSGGALLGVASAAGSALANYVSQRAVPDNSPLAALSSAEVLRVANTLNGLLQQGPGDDEFRLPELPQMVVVGTQSSGKSSLLNAIMAADLLPLGEAMVTRCPLHLQLVHAPNESHQMRAEFGSYAGGEWTMHRLIHMSCPHPTPSEIAHIRQEIESQTISLAGPGKCVSAEPIHLRIYSPFVPDLSLVDLPGLTMMALTDQGQPRDIKEQITRLVRAHIDKPRAVILAVLPARTDLEADAALELVKEVDPRGERTIGVLTKVDLMNQGADISPYLVDDGRVAKDLRLALGYFAVRNRSTPEVMREGLTVDAGFEREAAYFQTHPIYAQMPAGARARLGVPNLARAMSNLLVHSVHQHLPTIIQEISESVDKTQRDMMALGPPLPRDDASRLALVQQVLGEFCREFMGCLVEKRADVRTGRRIKDVFAKLRGDIHGTDAINKETYPDEYIAEAVKDCEGNHLSFPVPPIEVLEQMLQNPEKAPIRKLLAPCVAAADETRGELKELAARLGDAPALARFPKLRSLVLDEVNQLIQGAYAETATKLAELVAMEESYISTEDAAFLQDLHAAVRKMVQNMNAAVLRDILRSYYGTVQRNLANAAPKAIMLFLVNGVRGRVHSMLFEQVMKAHVPALLDEPEDMRSRRDVLQNRLDRLNAARAELKQCEMHKGGSGRDGAQNGRRSSSSK